VTLVWPSVLVTLTSALTVIVVVAVALLLVVSGSNVSLLAALAVLLTDGPVKAGSTWTT